jgi:hypothetical protein
MVLWRLKIAALFFNRKRRFFSESRKTYVFIFYRVFYPFSLVLCPLIETFVDVNEPSFFVLR